MGGFDACADFRRFHEYTDGYGTVVPIVQQLTIFPFIHADGRSFFSTTTKTTTLPAPRSTGKIAAYPRTSHRRSPSSPP